MLDITAKRRGQVRHPGPLDLLRWAAGERDAALEHHVRSCPACAAEIAELRASMTALVDTAEAAAAGAGCLDDMAIAALAEGGLGAEQHAPLVDHLAECAVCRGAVAAVTAALADHAVAAELRALESPRPRRWPHVAGAVAAIGLLLLLVQPWPGDDAPAVHRARSAATAPAPEPVAPVGAVAEARVLRWRSVPGADVYRVTVYDDQGAVLHERVIAGTADRLPEGVRLRPGQRYYWTVAARTGWDRWTVAELTEFSLPEPAR